MLLGAAVAPGAIVEAVLDITRETLDRRIALRLHRLMRRLIALACLALAGAIAPVAARATVTHPYVGLTLIEEAATAPRPIKTHVLQVDLSTPGIRLTLTLVTVLLGVVVLAMTKLTDFWLFFAAILLTRGLGQSALSVVSLSMTGKGEQTLLTLEIEDYEQLDNVVERLTRR